MNIIEATKAMEEGKTVRRISATIAEAKFDGWKATRVEGVKTNDSGAVIPASTKKFDVPFVCLTTEALLADDWEIVE